VQTDLNIIYKNKSQIHPTALVT